MRKVAVTLACAGIFCIIGSGCGERRTKPGEGVPKAGPEGVTTQAPSPSDSPRNSDLPTTGDLAGLPPDQARTIMEAVGDQRGLPPLPQVKPEDVGRFVLINPTEVRLIFPDQGYAKTQIQFQALKISFGGSPGEEASFQLIPNTNQCVAKLSAPMDNPTTALVALNRRAFVDDKLVVPIEAYAKDSALQIVGFEPKPDTKALDAAAAVEKALEQLRPMRESGDAAARRANAQTLLDQIGIFRTLTSGRLDMATDDAAGELSLQAQDILAALDDGKALPSDAEFERLIQAARSLQQAGKRGSAGADARSPSTSAAAPTSAPEAQTKP